MRWTWLCGWCVVTQLGRREEASAAYRILDIAANRRKPELLRLQFNTESAFPRQISDTCKPPITPHPTPHHHHHKQHRRHGGQACEDAAFHRRYFTHEAARPCGSPTGSLGLVGRYTDHVDEVGVSRRGTPTTTLAGTRRWLIPCPPWSFHRGLQRRNSSYNRFVSTVEESLSFRCSEPFSIFSIPKNYETMDDWDTPIWSTGNFNLCFSEYRSGPSVSPQYETSRPDASVAFATISGNVTPLALASRQRELSHLILKPRLTRVLCNFGIKCLHASMQLLNDFRLCLCQIVLLTHILRKVKEV